MVFYASSIKTANYQTPWPTVKAVDRLLASWVSHELEPTRFFPNEKNHIEPLHDKRYGIIHMLTCMKNFHV